MRSPSSAAMGNCLGEGPFGRVNWVTANNLLIEFDLAGAGLTTAEEGRTVGSS